MTKIKSVISDEESFVNDDMSYYAEFKKLLVLENKITVDIHRTK